MYEDFEEEFAGADGLDLNAMGGDDLDLDATGLAVEKTQSAYKINVTIPSNNGGGKIVLFGRDRFLTETNYGSSAGVVVNSAYANTTYPELLNQSAIKPFSVNLIRLRTDNTAVFDYVMSLFSKDANGQKLEIPLDPSIYYSPRQFDKNTIDIPFIFQMDSNNYMVWDLPTVLFQNAPLNLSFTFFPMGSVSISRALTGGSLGRRYPKPNVPTVLPVKEVHSIKLPFKRG